MMLKSAAIIRFLPALLIRLKSIQDCKDKHLSIRALKTIIVLTVQTRLLFNPSNQPQLRSNPDQ